MVNTNQKPVRDTQKIKRNANITLKKVIKPQGKRIKEGKNREELHKQPENKQQNGNKFIPINNHFKCKWTKCLNQKTYSGRKTFKMMEE